MDVIYILQHYIYILKHIISDDRYYSIIVLVYLAVMLPLVIYSRKCFWKLVCKASGRTAEEVSQKKRELIAQRTGSVSRASDSGFSLYLQELAPNQGAVLILYKIYGLSIFPLIASIAEFVLSLLNSNFKRMIPYFLLAVPIVSLAMLIGAKIGMKHEFRYVEKKNNRTPSYYLSLVMRIVFAIIFCAAGVWFMVAGVNIYNEQVSQKDWPETTAVIFSETVKGSYIYYYSYNVDDQTHYGRIESKGDAHNAGEILTVKYNPKDPDQSTHILEPHISTIIVNGIGGLFFIGVGVYVYFIDKIHERRVARAKMKYGNQQ